MTLWEAQVLCNADSCHASMAEDRESGATQYTFLAVQFDRTRRAVSLSDKFVRSLRAVPSLKSLTIAGMEVMASRFLYAAAIFGHAFMRLLLFHQGSATTIIRTSPGNCAGDIPGEPSAVSGWFGREIATHDRE
ncbi:putative target of rapamycin (TOR) kinase 1 [Trypanosoma cruzi]|nr:putative target of rapamycin (TOR) kinase 1 [Trypanosoma cruzi]